MLTSEQLLALKNALIGLGTNFGTSPDVANKGLDHKVFKAAISNLSTGSTKEFQYNPESWTDNRTINYASLVVPGISFPRYQFVAGGDTVVSFKLFFNAMNLKGGGDELLTYVYWFRSLTYPQNSSSGILKAAPPLVLFIWPGMYSSRGVLSIANLEWISFFPDGKPKHGYLTIEIKKTSF